MINVGILGIGNTGNQIAYLANQKIKVPVMCINTSEKDLETIGNVPKFLIGESVGARGAGKNRNLAKSLLKSSIMKLLNSEEFVDFADGLDVLFVISSTGGGTGSGTALLCATLLAHNNPKLRVIPIGVLPVLSEALSAHINTVEYLKELYNNMDGASYMLYDNERASDMPSYKMMATVNDAVVEDINVLRGYYNHTTKYDSIDEQDMLRILGIGGRIMVTSTVVSERALDRKDIETMMIDSLKDNYHVDFQRDKVCGATGVISNLPESIIAKFDIHVPQVREIIGVPIHDFTHTEVVDGKEGRVILITAGMSPVNDRMKAISDIIDEVESAQNGTEENFINNFDSKLLNKFSEPAAPKNETSGSNMDIMNVFDMFGVD